MFGGNNTRHGKSYTTKTIGLIILLFGFDAILYLFVIIRVINP